MTADTLQMMVDSISDEMLPDFFPGQRAPVACAAGASLEVARFILAYRDYGFGWKYAYAFARRGEFIPLEMDPEDRAIVEANYFCLNPERLGSPVIKRVMALSSPQLRQEAAVLQALLLVPRLSFEEIARQVSQPLEVVEAYHTLFFNIRSRMDDGMYLRHIVYPDSRLANLMSGRRPDREDAGRLLRESALTEGVSSVLYLAGVGNTPALEVSDARQQLERKIIGQAAILANNGWLDNANGHASITMARQLIQADKLGGNDDNGPRSPGSVIGALLLNDVKTLRLRQVGEQAHARAEMLQSSMPAAEAS